MSKDSECYTTDEDDSELEYTLYSENVNNYKDLSSKKIKNREFGIIGDAVNILIINKTLENFHKKRNDTNNKRQSIKHNAFKKNNKISCFQKIKNLIK